MSYKDVLTLYDIWTNFDIDQNRTCSEELAEVLYGTAVMDNDDFKDDTMTGPNMSHGKCHVRPTKQLDA